MLDQRTQGARGVPPLRVIQVVARKGLAVRLEYAYQLSPLDRVAHVGLVCERQAQPRDGEPPVEPRIGREHTGPHRHREHAPVFRELPTIRSGVRRRMPVETVVLDELARMLRLPPSREVGRRTYDGQPQVAGDG